MVGPSEARMKNEALKKNETAENYSSDASVADSNSNDCPVSKIVPLLVSGSASVPRGVSETMSENVLSKKETSQPLVDEGGQFDDEDKNDEDTIVQGKDSVPILVSGSALVQRDVSEPERDQNYDQNRGDLR